MKRMKNKVQYILNNNREAFHFLILFLLFSLVFFSIYFLFQKSLEFMLFGTATITGFFSNIIDMTVVVDGTILSLGTIDFEIIHECTGIFAIMIISSSILAYPTQYKQKIIGIIFIIPLILSLNIIRLLILIYVGKFHINLFEIVHSYLWQGTFIIFIILAWFLWIELVVNR